MQIEETDRPPAAPTQAAANPIALPASGGLTWVRTGLLLAGAFCYASAFPPLELAVAGWLAPLLWIAALHRLGAKGRFSAAFIGGFTTAAIVLFWLWPIFSALSFFLWGLTAFYFGLWGLVMGAVRKGPVRIALWGAVAWCGVEYLRGEIAPLSFSWMALGYSQQNRVGYAIASVIGVYGLSLVMVLWAACVFGLAKQMLLSKLRPKPPFVIGLALLALIPTASFLDPPPWKGSVMGYAELQQYSEQDEIAALPVADVPPVPRTDLVVLPEYCLFDDPYENHSSWFLELMRREASSARWGVVFGAIDVPDGRPREEGYRNTAFVLDSSGRLTGKAVKNQPIQLLRDGDPADDVAVLEISPQTTQSLALRAGVGICYDGSFQRFSLRMARRGADFLVFPTYNADAWGASQYRQHQRMFQTRAAETGRCVLVAATSGPTFAAFPGGTASTVLPFRKTNRLPVPIATPDPTTVFVTSGWILGPGAVALTVSGCLRALLQRRRRSAAADRRLGQS